MSGSRWYMVALLVAATCMVAGGAVMSNGGSHSYQIVTDAQASTICGGGNCGMTVGTACGWISVGNTCTGLLSCSGRCGYNCLWTLDAVPGTAFQNQIAAFPCPTAFEEACGWSSLGVPLGCWCWRAGGVNRNCGTTHIPGATCTEE